MEVTVLDTSLNRTAVLDVFDSLIWTDRYWKHGDFEIYTKANLEVIGLLQQDYYLSIPESEHLMVIETVELKTDVEVGDHYIVKGRSLESILDRRIIWHQTVLSGTLQTGIKRLLDENAIAPSDNDRRILNLVFEESLDESIISIPIDTQFFGENLYTAIQQLCESAGIGFKIILSDGQFVFSLYAGADRTFNQIENPFVAFSPDLDNISNTNFYHSRMPLKTITLVGGEGEGSDKVLTQVALPGITNTDLNRREKFTDASDVSSMVDGAELDDSQYATLLAHRGLISLLESQPVSAFDGEVDPNVNYIYGVDYFLGDIVQIANEYGLTGITRITELIFSEDPSGRDIYPTFTMIE